MTPNNVYPDSCLQCEYLQLWAAPNLTWITLRHFLKHQLLKPDVCCVQGKEARSFLHAVTRHGLCISLQTVRPKRLEEHTGPLCNSLEVRWGETRTPPPLPPFVSLPVPDDFLSPGGKHCAKSKSSDWSSSWLHSQRCSNIFSGNTANLMDRVPGKGRWENLKNGLLQKDINQSTYFLQLEKVSDAAVSDCII